MAAFEHIARFVRSYGRLPVGDARSFQRVVILPEIFVFILYVSVGAALHEPLSASIFKLAAIAYLLVVNTVVQSALRVYSVRLLTFHVVALCLLLSISSLLLGQEALLSVFMPMAIILVLFVLVPLTWSSALAICLLSAVVLTCFWLVDVKLANRALHQETRGPLLICLAYLVLLFRSLFRPAHSLAAIGAIPLSQPLTPSGGFSAPSAAVSDTAINGVLMQDSSLYFMEELKAELSWRLPLISLMYTAILVSAIFATQHLHGTLAASAALLVLAQLLLLYRSRSARSTRALYSYALALGAIGAGWWCLFVQSGAGVGISGDLALCLLVLTFGSLPWTVSLSLTFPAFFLLQLAFREPAVSQPFLFALIVWFTTAAAL
ncbi:MAG: hypothetical protein J0M12_15820, partial [Deltaproteobacteria bacterium]|nr:hypothetical protein [Deltaproteobacteria bacterium]